MKLIKPSFEILEQEPSLNGIYKAIERAGRVSYKSEDKITKDSAKPFVDRMVNSGHGGVLEHGTVYLDIPYIEAYSLFPETNWVRDEYGGNPYSYIRLHGPHFYVTTNYRYIIENNWLDDLKYLCEPTKYHAKRITVKFTCDRGVSHEFVRHRVFSFLQESTRYCNYSKNKFNNEITYIIPCWLDVDKGSYKVISYKMVHNNKDLYYIDDVSSVDRLFLNSLYTNEMLYFSLLEQGWKPQQARAVLPNTLKTELVMTGFVDDWWGKYTVIDKNTGLIYRVIDGRNYKEVDTIDRDRYRIIEKGFFPLRCSSAAHPQAQELAIPLREEFIKRGY